MPSGTSETRDRHTACHFRARTSGKLRSPAVTHGHRERLPIWACAGWPLPETTGPTPTSWMRSGCARSPSGTGASPCVRSHRAASRTRPGREGVLLCHRCSPCRGQCIRDGRHAVGSGRAGDDVTAGPRRSRECRASRAPPGAGAVLPDHVTSTTGYAAETPAGRRGDGDPSSAGRGI